MIHVLITSKESRRFPGKNGSLWEYTAAWLAAECMSSAEPVRVWFAGAVPEGAKVPAGWRVLDVHAADHHELQQAMEDAVLAECGRDGAPVFVLAQLTQPLRRRGLLADVVYVCRAFGAAGTYCVGRLDEWRVVSCRGWGKPRDGVCRLMDGALFAWRPGRLEDSWRPGVPYTRRGMVANYRGPVVDVDAPGDLPPALDAMWAKLMLGHRDV